MVRVGDVQITRIEEIVLHEQTILFKDWRPEIAEEYRDLLVPNFYDPEAAAFRVSIHSWLVQTPKQTILIDTCGGNGRERPASPRFHHLDTPYLDRLRAAGVTPEAVDLVICTHLHVDHVGWNTQFVGGRWVPTFPAARYIFPRVEVEWRDPRRTTANRPEAANLPFLDSVQPILDAGRATLVEGNERLSDEIDFIPTPGHAPGQMAVRVRSRGEEAVFVADVTHLPIQVYFPDWSTRYCEDPVLAASTRKAMFEYLAERNCLFFPGHYCHPHGGYLRRRGEGFAFVPAGSAP